MRQETVKRVFPKHTFSESDKYDLGTGQYHWVSETHGIAYSPELRRWTVRRDGIHSSGPSLSRCRTRVDQFRAYHADRLGPRRSAPSVQEMSS